MVNQPGERAERAVGLGEQTHHVRFIARVALYGERASARGFDVAHDGVRFLLGLAIVDNNGRLLAPKQPRGCRADAAAASGDDDDLPAHTSAKRASATPCSS